METAKYRQRKRKRFRRPKPEWLMRKLSKKEVYGSDEAAIVLGNDPKNVRELVYRERLKPISGPPYRFEASTVKGFVRQKPGRKPKPKPKTLKRFIPKRKRGGDLNDREITKIRNA